LKIALVSLLALAFILPFSTPANAVAFTVAPGDMIVIDNSTVCTINFVFDGTGSLAGKVYVGTAAHCLEGKHSARIDHYGGHVLGTQNGGYLLGTNDGPDFATVAYIGDYPSSANGGTAVENGIAGTQLDFALLQVRSAYTSVVSPAVRGHTGMPTAVAGTPDMTPGSLILHSGHGTAYSDVQLLRENHVGVLGLTNALAYQEVGTTMPGDSGGPVLLSSGKALGVVSSMGATGDVGPRMDAILSEIAGLGYTVTLRHA